MLPLGNKADPSLLSQQFFTAEQAVCDCTARDVMLAAAVIFERLAVVTRRLADVPEQLAVVSGFDVAAMVLEEVGESVVYLMTEKKSG